MNLRIYRTFKWTMAKPDPSSCFSQAYYALEAHDELQYQEADHRPWKKVPVVEAEKPMHPEEIKRLEQLESLKEVLKEGPATEFHGRTSL